MAATSASATPKQKKSLFEDDDGDAGKPEQKRDKRYKHDFHIPICVAL